MWVSKKVGLERRGRVPNKIYLEKVRIIYESMTICTLRYVYRIFAIRSLALKELSPKIIWSEAPNKSQEACIPDLSCESRYERISNCNPDYLRGKNRICIENKK